MTSEDFCNWLKGYLELTNPAEIRAREIEVIREHLELTKQNRFSDPPYYPNSLRNTPAGDKVRPAYC